MNGLLLRTAHHEAAHAVAVVRLGFRVMRFEIFDEARGNVTWSRGVAPNSWANVAIMVIAGLVAEWILEGRSIAPWAGEALPLIRERASHPSAGDVFQFDDAVRKGAREDEAIAAAELLLRAEWPAVERLAERVVSRMGTSTSLELLGAEAHDLVVAAMEDGPDGKPEARP